jgi:hypothetical protein
MSTSFVKEHISEGLFIIISPLDAILSLINPKEQHGDGPCLKVTRPRSPQPLLALALALAYGCLLQASRGRAPIPKDQRGDGTVTNAAHIVDCALANKLLPRDTLPKDQKEALDRLLTSTPNLPQAVGGADNSQGASPLSGVEFRKKSEKAAGAVPVASVAARQSGRVTEYTRCHKVPNELCTEAYNTAPSEKVQAEILEFGFSKENLILATDDRNERIHNAAETDLKADKATKRQQDMKGDQIATAMDQALRSGKVSPETAAHLLETIGKTSKQMAEVVASLDKRVFHHPEVKEVINRCRDSKRPEQRTGLKNDGAPSRRTNVDDALSAESTPQKSPPAPTPPSPAPVGSGMTAARTGDSGSSGGGTRASNLDRYNAFQKSPEIAGKGYDRSQISELYHAHKAATAAPAASTAPAVTVAPAPAPVNTPVPSVRTPVPSVRAPAASASAPSSSGGSGYGSAYSGSSGGYGGSSGGSGGGSSYGGSSGGGGSSSGGGGTFYKGGQFLPGGGRAPSGGTYR